MERMRYLLIRDLLLGNRNADRDTNSGSSTCSSTGGIARKLATGISFSSFIGGMMFMVSAGSAADTAPGDIKFMEDNSQVMASISGKAGDAAAGRKLFSNRKLGNCLACHTNSDMKEHSFHGEVGPSLDGVAERYKLAELRAILIDSKKALNEDTIMPGFYSLSLGVRVAGKFKGKTVLNAQQVEDVVAYLQTLK